MGSARHATHCKRCDRGDNVSREYKTPGEFTGGTIHAVEVNVGKEQYVDLEMAAVAGLDSAADHQ